MRNILVVAKADCDVAGFRAQGEQFLLSVEDGEALPPFLEVAEVEAPYNPDGAPVPTPDTVIDHTQQMTQGE